MNQQRGNLEKKEEKGDMKTDITGNRYVTAEGRKNQVKVLSKKSLQ